MTFTVVIDTAALDVTARAFRDQGLRVAAPGEIDQLPWSLVGHAVVGVVASESEASMVVFAAARGAKVAVTLAPSAERLRADLEHDLGRLADDGTPGAAAVDVSALPEETLRLLRKLAEGLTLPEAAAACFMSERTAFRRVGQARKVLGVATTTEAAVAVARAGG
jgi:DNA-binding NarL/FixJ family response regulator